MSLEHIADKIKAKQPITREEFREIVNATNWGSATKDYLNRMNIVAEKHEVARARSYARCQFEYIS